MKATKTTPRWAIELVEQVCSDYNRALPRSLKWYKTGKVKKVYSYDSETRTFGYRPAKRVKRFSNGHTTCELNTEIFVRTGSIEYDQEFVLLHELAHHIMHRSKSGRRAGHNLKFWRLAFELYDRYGLHVPYAYYREEVYRKGATVAYEEWKARQV